MAAKKFFSLIVVALCLTKTSSDQTVCETEPMGTVLPKNDDCHQYILCLYQTAFTKSCPTGEGFSLAAKGCVDYNKSDCQMTTTKPTLAPSLENGTCIYEERPACEGQAFGALVPYPGNCTMFLVCNFKNPTVKICPAGTLFDDNLKICNFPDSVNCDEETAAGETGKATSQTTKMINTATTESSKWA